MIFSRIREGLMELASLLGLDPKESYDNVWEMFKKQDDLQNLYESLRRPLTFRNEVIPGLNEDIALEVFSGNKEAAKVAMELKNEDLIDLEFLKEVEGFKTSGYIPKDSSGKTLGNSGVTVGVGVDLGQQSLEGLRTAGVKGEMLQKLLPFIGVRGPEADRRLKTEGLKLSKEEAEELSRAVVSRDLQSLEDAFDSDSDLKFKNLPKEARTVLASVKHQYGDPRSRTPKFWGHMTSGDFEKAIGELEDFGDDYSTRRTKEAEVLGRFRG